MPDERGERSALETEVNWGVGLHAPIGQGVDETAYDRYIGRWSQLFVPSLLAAAGVGVDDHVLDVATGTGEAALLLLPAVGPRGLVVGVDISVRMLEAAAVRVHNERYSPVVADALSLPFRVGYFDAVVCQLGLMFLADPERALAEFRRTLRPGRRSAVCVISSAEKAPMWGALAEALSRYLPNQTKMLHLSFSLSDPGELERLFRVAGFGEVRVTRETRVGRVESFEEYWAPIEAGTGSLPQAYLALPEATRLKVRTEVRDRLSAFEQHGQYELSVEMLIGSGANP